jgi:hypothetical protein
MALRPPRVLQKWIASLKAGIDGKPEDFEYVRIAA